MEPYARVEACFGLLDDLPGMFGREIDLVMVGARRHRRTNLRRPNASTAADTFNRSRKVVPMSGPSRLLW